MSRDEICENDWNNGRNGDSSGRVRLRLVEMIGIMVEMATVVVVSG